MNAWKVSAVAVIGMTLFAFLGTASAQNRYKLNVQAYKGIVFAEMFGKTPGAPFEEPSTVGENCREYAGVEGTLSLEALVARFLANLDLYAPAEPADAELAATVTSRLISLQQYIETTSVVANGCFGSWPIRWFFEEDMQNKVFVSQSIQMAIGSLFNDYLVPLEGDGLTLPWLVVTGRAANIDFLDLVFNTRFLQRFSRMTYRDFFEINADGPLVDDELMELARRAIQAGLLGALPVYYNDPSVPLSLIELITPTGISGNAKCCDRTERVCVSSTTASHYCVMVGNYCCLGATWCPL